MMNIALIIAGGLGSRMEQDIPKQFLHVNDKPIIIYTLEAFQNHSEIDSIEVVCLDGWEKMLNAYCKQFNITKIENIIPGGLNGQDSIRNGVYDLMTRHSEDDIVLVHDAIRPMISMEIISENLKVCREKGNAIAVIPCAEAMLKTKDGIVSSVQVARKNLKRAQTPQAFKLGKLAWAHKEALERGITNSVASCTMFIELGERLYFSKGSEKNVKLTTADDVDIFKALLQAQRPYWFK